MVLKSANEKSIQQIYGRVKVEIVNRAFYPGERINIEKCAEKLRVSTTPVREVLNRMVAEDLVDLVPQMGFFMKRLSEADMRDILEFNALLVSWSLTDFQRQYPDCSLSLVPPLPSELKDIGKRDRIGASQLAVMTGMFFLHIAKLSGNQEIICRVASCNDRLQPARVCEFTENEKSFNIARHFSLQLTLRKTITKSSPPICPIKFSLSGTCSLIKWLTNCIASSPTA